MDGVGLLLAADRGAADGDGASGLLQSPPEGGEVDGRVQSGGGGDSRMGDNRRKKEMGLSEGRRNNFLFFFFFSFFDFFILFLSFFSTKEEKRGKST